MGKGNSIRITENSGNNEHFTPPELIRAAAAAMGGIDTDPATCEVVNRQVVKARLWYDQDSNGLEQEWDGRVWLNPPFERGLINDFVEKLRDELDCGRVDQACVLTHNASETRWYNRLLERANAICFLAGRVRFHELDADGELYQPRGAPLQGQFVTYFGQRSDHFRAAFAPFGHCLINNLPTREIKIPVGQRAFMSARNGGEVRAGLPNQLPQTKPATDIFCANFVSTRYVEMARYILRSLWARELEDAVDTKVMSLEAAYAEMRRRSSEPD